MISTYINTHIHTWKHVYSFKVEFQNSILHLFIQILVTRVWILFLPFSWSLVFGQADTGIFTEQMKITISSILIEENDFFLGEKAFVQRILN